MRGRRISPGEHLGVPRAPVLPAGQGERAAEIRQAAFAAVANNQLGGVTIRPPDDYGPDDRAAFWREVERWRQPASGRGLGWTEGSR